MKMKYPQTGELLIKSGTAIQALLSEAKDRDNFDVLCKSLAANIGHLAEKRTPTKPKSAPAATGIANENQLTAYLQTQRLAEAMLAKSLNNMRALGQSHFEITSVKHQCERAIASSIFGAQCVIEALKKNQG